jgi:hypothetical protein
MIVYSVINIIYTDMFPKQEVDWQKDTNNEQETYFSSPGIQFDYSTKKRTDSQYNHNGYMFSELEIKMGELFRLQRHNINVYV